MRSHGRLRKSPRVTRVFVAPGNAGTAREPKVQNVAHRRARLSRRLADFVRREDVASHDRRTRSAAGGRYSRLLRRARTAVFRTVAGGRATRGVEGIHQVVPGTPSDSHRRVSRLYGSGSGRGYIRERGVPIVVKADGLAAGKGVVVARAPRRSVGRRARHARPETLSATRVARSSSKTVSSAKKRASSASPTVAARCRSRVRRITKRATTAIAGPNTGGHGRLFAGAGRHAGDSRSESWRK